MEEEAGMEGGREWKRGEGMGQGEEMAKEVETMLKFKLKP